MSSPGENPQLRALIYNRVSADPSGRRVSVESQDAENRAFCSAQGWEVVATIVDNDRSASRFAAKQREGYRQVREALAGGTHGRIDVLVCWESSRAQRDLADYVAMRDLCTEHSVLLAYKGRVYDLAQGDDRFSTGLDALVDEREAERIRERVLRGHRTSVHQGRPRGVVPFGYLREYDAHDGRLVAQKPCPETAPVVREITRRVLGGDTLYAVAQDLNRRGVLTPRGHRDVSAGRASDRAGWSSSMIRNLLVKPSLVGVRTHRGVPVRDAVWPAIVDPADWAAVQAVLADPTRSRNPRGVATRYLLSGIAECGVCGAWLRPLTNRGRPTYVCAGLVPTAGKGHVSRSRPALDERVVKALLVFLARPDVVPQLAEREKDDAAAEAAQEAAGLQARLDAFIASAAGGGVSPEALAGIEAQLRPQIHDARTRAIPRGAPPALANLLGPSVHDGWSELGLDGQRQVIRHLMRVIVHPAAPGVYGFDPTRVEIRWSTSA